MDRTSSAAFAPLLPLGRPLLGAVLLAALLAPSAAFAAGGASGGSAPTIPTEPRRIREDVTADTTVPQRGLPASVRIEGQVHTVSNEPLANLRVRLFSNGVSLETVTTDMDGSFQLSANPMVGENNTSDLWIETPDPEKYVDVNVLLSAGRVAREQRLYSACTPQVNVTANGAAIDVTMFSIDEEKQALAESKCLETEP